MRRCPDPDAFYLARDPEHLDHLLRGHGPGCCPDPTHNHRIMPLWDLAAHLEMKDA